MLSKTMLVMKLTMLFLTAAFFNVSAKSLSQTTITFSGTNTPLSKVFDVVRQQTGYAVVYNVDILNNAPPVSIRAVNQPLRIFLEEVFQHRALSYSIKNTTIFVSRRPAGRDEDGHDDPLPAPAPPIEVSGRVVSETGEGLAGVSIMIRGTRTGTVSDNEGRFRLNVRDEKATLVFSSTGYEIQEVAVEETSDLVVTLKLSNSRMSEVVVTALGIRREKKALSYSVSEVKGDDLTKARENNVGNALSGRVAGVNATSTATGPAGSSRVIIRGNGSLSGDNQPLYVVNGIPINASNQGTPGTFGGKDLGDGLVSINPDDIESISVLKGGPAAALYGSRAANGVILITTKSGRLQRGIGVEYNGAFTRESALTLPDWQYEYGSGTRGQKPTSQAEAVANGRTSWGAPLDGSMVIQPDGNSRPYVAQRDNIKNFYQTGNTFSNTVAISASGKGAGFRFSAADMNSEGIVPNSGLNRKTFNLSANANLSEKVIFEGKAQYSIERTENRTNIGDFTANPTSSVGLVATSIDVRTLAPGYDAQQFETPWNDYVFVTNPYFVINKVRNNDDRRRFIGSFSTRYNITDFLYARGRLGTDQLNFDTYDLTPTGILYNSRGALTTGQHKLQETNAEVIVGFEKNKGNLTVNAFVGGNKMQNQRTSLTLSSGNLNVPFNYFIGNGSSQTFTNTFSKFAINSLFASADVGYRNILFLSLTGRQDWFSTLSPESNSLFYPSAGLSVILSELWESRPSWMNYAKIRGSWAQVGGGAPDPYGIVLAYTASSIQHLGQPIMTISSPTIPNALKPYTSTTAEAGFEMRMLNNRLSVDLTLYDRTTTNDIVSASVSPASSYNDVRLNVGEIKNKGVELLLSGTPVQNPQGLEWNVSYNVAYNDNRVVRIADGLTSLAGAQPRTQNAFVYHFEGQPYGMIAGYSERVDEKGSNVYNNANGLPMQSALMPLGRGVPPLTMGLSNTFNYGNFNLGFLIDGKFGSVLYSATNAYATFYGLHKKTVEDGVREKGVIVSGVDQNGAPFNQTVPAQNYYQGIAYSITDQFVSDASFVKLRQLTFGYSFPRKLLNRTPVQTASISLVARNLLLLYSGTDNVDPESSYSVAGNSQGLENFGVLPTRSFGVNLMFSF